MPRALRPLLVALSLSLLPASWPLHAEEPGATAADAGAASDSGAAPASARPPQAERSAAAAAALAERLPAQEQQQLQATDESFLALWLPANVPQAHGVVVLLGGDGESPDWPASLGPLRRKLPDAGWHSLALGLPDPPDSQPQARRPDKPASAADTPAADEAAATPAAPPAPAAADGEEMAAAAAAPEDPATRHARRIQQRIAAALQLARQQKSARIVLLGHGSGAYWGARYLSEEQPADVQNLLMVAVESPADASPALDELLPRLKLATGDFYYRDRPAERLAAAGRAQASKRQAHPAYIQVAMTALPGNPELQQEQLYRRLRGWLSLQLQAR